jgi:3-deoxy-D-arabino-heptulosonate 7-phosphate (DAHP) synthase
MKVIEDPYYASHYAKTVKRIDSVNRYLFMLLLPCAVAYTLGVMSWGLFSIVLSACLSLKLLIYMRVYTAKKRWSMHTQSIVKR